MAGLRSDDEMMKAFEGLDYVPGSKKKRREMSPAAEARKVKAQEGWDSNPIKKVLNGKDVEFFTINALAEALGKEVVTIRRWEAKGYIPKAPYRLRSKTLNGKKVGGSRVYTRDLIESAIQEFESRGLLGSARVEWNLHGSLTIRLTERWKQLVADKN
jgi:hypothetical protein